jgi:chromosomal replication initiation ATPase DnaA
MTPAQRAIIEDVARRHGLRLSDLVGVSRIRPVVYARHEAFWIMRRDGRWSTPQIGRVMGCRDHTTVIAGARGHERRAALTHSRDSQANAAGSLAIIHNQ